MDSNYKKMCARGGCTVLMVKKYNRSVREFGIKRYCSFTCSNLERLRAAAAKKCDCGTDAPHYARGMCWSCYSREVYGRTVAPGTLGPRQKAS